MEKSFFGGGRGNFRAGIEKSDYKIRDTLDERAAPVCMVRLRVFYQLIYGVHDDNIAKLILETSRGSHRIEIACEFLALRTRYDFIIIYKVHLTLRINNETE